MSNIFKYLWKGTLLLILLTVLGVACSDITSISKKYLKKYGKNKGFTVMIDGVRNFELPPPLVVLNGRIITDSGIIIDPLDIDSINILKGKKAIKIYGKAAKNGVIAVFTDDSAKAKTDSVLVN